MKSDGRGIKTVQARQAKYPIRAVSKLTGVSIDTLRAWERRYNAITPTRDDRGRLYSEDDIARLRLLNQAVAAGHSIGRVAALANAELQQLTTAGSGVPASAVPDAPSALAGFSAALARFDSAAVDRELSRLAAITAPADLVSTVLLPILREVGDQWNRDRGGIAREHLMSAAMHNLLGSFLRLHARPDAAVRLLFATPSGDRHEIGTLGAAMLAASRGLGVLYLGADLPAAQIVEVVRASEDIAVVVLGVTLPGPVVSRELRAIARDLPAGIELWAGGAGAAEYTQILSKRGLVLRDFEAYLEQLARLVVRAS
jgi:DNA-binding transcriptional MerR regulator